MDILKMSAVLFLLFSRFHGEAEAAGLLSYNFYDQSCPQLESIVRSELRTLSLTDPTAPAALLRLLFHDCQVQGCDASILLDLNGVTTQYSEMASSKNFGVRKRETISLIKSTVETMCPQQVSCSDILVLAAREAVALSGGPRIDVPLGRRDSSNPPNVGFVDASLPPADIGVDGVLKLFAKKGMTVEETVAILGAHTLGVTHCSNLQSRLYNPATKQGYAVNPGFENTLKISCPLGPLASKIRFVENDVTSVLFDNRYYISSMNGRGVLRIDSEMPLDFRTRPFVEKFAINQEAFFQAFSSAFVKLSSFEVLTGNQGVIRTRCNALN
ncbi:hypothetical protein BUALT_Bualt14G0126300 [Buddleja alternifolia]|uniref:Peroxidase n=1 Tax=Buddleja alternifolia TaxID=168488 RepID=A0AAV6WIF6_9LAMI|nr:hypothetical protein BUALT_Bualt14G0126300 [Buddleja alternifolia]